MAYAKSWSLAHSAASILCGRIGEKHDIKCLTRKAGCCIMLIRKCPYIFGELQCTWLQKGLRWMVSHVQVRLISIGMVVHWIFSLLCGLFQAMFCFFWSRLFVKPFRGTQWRSRSLCSYWFSLRICWSPYLSEASGLWSVSDGVFGVGHSGKCLFSTQRIEEMVIRRP